MTNFIFMRRFFLVLIAFNLFLPILSGQEWIVPVDKKGKLSTFPFDDITRKAGEKLYTINCMSCHGTPGKSNYLNLIPPPGDPAKEKIQQNNDGEIFYKITVGRGQMPSFRSVLTPVELWKIISFIRSFNNSYKQEIMPVITSSAYPGAVINIVLEYDKTDNAIILKALAFKDSVVVPVNGAEMKMLVHRTFGQLPVDEVKITNKQGIAIFRIPENLPGDSAGNIQLSVRFTDEEVFGSVSKDTLLCCAAKTIPVSLVAERAMWNNVRKAPVWIILMFTIGLFTAWGFIFYVLMKLRDIFIIGETFATRIPEKENK